MITLLQDPSDRRAHRIQVPWYCDMWLRDFLELCPTAACDAPSTPSRRGPAHSSLSKLALNVAR